MNRKGNYQKFVSTADLRLKYLGIKIYRLYAQNKFFYNFYYFKTILAQNNVIKDC